MRYKDPGIPRRAAEELYKLPGTNREIAQRIGCNPNSITDWEVGRTIPSAYYLKRMYEIGCDVIYILTGERTR